MSKINKTLKNKFGIDRKTKPTKQDEGLTEQLTVEETSPPEQQLVEKVDEAKQREMEEEKFQAIEESFLKFAEKEALRLEEENKIKKLQESLLTPFTKNKEVDMQSTFDDTINRVLPKSKFTEVVQIPEPFSEEPALNKELSDFKTKINQHVQKVMTGTGGGLDPNKVANHFIPAVDNTFDLGAANKQWRNLYLSGSTLIVDGASIDSGELTALDGVTAGTVTASKAVIVDANKDITGFRNVSLSADASVLSFGTNSEITLTHVHDTGLTLTHTATGDNTPIVLQLKSEEDDIIADEVIASLEFAAGDSDGTDGATVAAGIHAIAEGTFSSSANATKLVFTTGVSETAAASATAKMTLSSAGLLTIADDFVIKDGGTIGSASSTSAMTIASTGIVTFVDDILIKDGGTIGSASSTSAITIASTGIVTLVDDLVIKDTGTIGSSTTPAAVSIAGDGTVDLATAGATVNSAVIKTAGTETIYVPASAMYPNTTNGCAALAQVELTAGRPELKVLDFDKDSDEFAQFTVAFPKSWNGGTVTFRAFWVGIAATTGIAWGLQAISVGDNAEADAAFGTAVVVTDDSQGDATEVLVTATSGALTISGAADDKMTFFQIFRDVSDANDDMAGDARLVGIQLFFTTDATNDA